MTSRKMRTQAEVNVVVALLVRRLPQEANKGDVLLTLNAFLWVLGFSPEEARVIMAEKCAECGLTLGEVL